MRPGDAEQVLAPARRSQVLDTVRDLAVLASLFELFRVTFAQSLQFENQSVYFQNLSDTSSSGVQQFATLAVLLLGLLLAVGDDRRKDALGIAAPLLPFLVLALVSTLWSDYPQLTFRRSARLAIETMAIVLIAMSYARDWRRLFDLLLLFCGVVAFLNAASLAVPSMSFSVLGFNGVHPHKLEAGRFILFAVPVFLIGVVSDERAVQRVLASGGLMICLLLLPLTHAKTALVAVPCGLLAASALVFGLNGHAVKGFLGCACIGLAGLLLFLLVFGAEPDVVLQTVFGDTTLTGRDLIWRYTFDRLNGHEMLGVGYGGLWQTGQEVVTRLRDGYKIYAVNQAHNGYIDVLAQTGLVGGLLLAGSIAGLSVEVIRSLNRVPRPLAFLTIYLLVAMLILNLTDTSFFWANSSFWSVPLLIYATLAAVRRRGAADLQAGAGNHSLPARPAVA